jgi:outer membrane protein insertion porin family
MKYDVKKVILGLCLSFLLVQPSFANSNFVVGRIKVVGLQRITLNTVNNYLPVHVGEKLDAKKTAKIIRTLYDTGFFQAVDLERQGNVLVVHVVERGTIGSVSLKGNKEIQTDRLKEVLKQMGIVKGRVFQRATLEQFRLQLKQEYNSRGKYNARITAKTTPLTQNRLGISIDISEGRVARIKEIKIIGEKAFSESTLLSLFSLSSSNIITYFSKKDQYSSHEMDKSLETIRNYYLDRGYLRFKIESQQVLLTPDRKSVYINIKVSEGPKYTFSGFKLVGKTILPRDKMAALVHIKKGSVFSRKLVTEAIKAMGEALGNIGYGFPAINAEPKIDEALHQVFISFVINPGRHVYVRRINFNGNTKTAEYVLRQVIKQNEGSILSLQNVHESERQLKILGYLKNVNVKTVPVPTANNQVDLDFNVEEAPTAEASASVGYGTNGPELNASFNQHNFMGTGDTLGLNFNTSYWGQSYGFNFYDPFYRPNIGRGYSLFYQTMTPGKFNISSYTSDKYGFASNYNMIIGDTTSLQLGYGLDRFNITSIGTNPANQILNFIDANGRDFVQVKLSGGWNHNTYNVQPYPTKGINQQATFVVALPATNKALEYYKLSYSAHAFIPFWDSGFILSLLGNGGYGNTFNRQGLPFYENYYAGGIAQPAQVRGYDSYSLGPRDSNGENLGGNIFASGSVGIILPAPLSRSSVRTTAFFDFGNVWSRDLPLNQRGTASGPLRYSAGVSVDWRSPFGPISFSLAKALKVLPGDRLEPFQFTISSGF